MVYGNFNEEAQAVWDFVRCVRPDGTAYGTKGKCRKGTEQAKETVPPKEKGRKKDTKEGKNGSGGEEVPEAVNASMDKLKEKVAAKVKSKGKVKEKKLTPEQEEAERDRAQKKANLSPEHRETLREYSDDMNQSFATTNRCLRDPDDCRSPEFSRNFSERMDAALAALPKNPRGSTFYRGVDASWGAAEELYASLENAKPGTRLKDPGFGSYSANPRIADEFSGGGAGPAIIFKSRNPNLTPMNTFSSIPKEKEAILPRGTEQTIRSVTRDGDTLIVELD